MGLFGALLALPIIGLLLVQWTEWNENRLAAAQAVAAGRNLVVVGQAVERYVHANYGSLSDGEIPVADLVAADLLPAGFTGAGDAMKRPARVWLLDVGGGRLRVVSMQVVPDDDGRRPDAGVFEARAGQWLGLVDGSGFLGAPGGFKEDVTAFQGAPGAGGHPKANALALYQEFDRELVCGDFLFRKSRAGCPHAGRMETDLDLGGNDVTGVGRLEAARLVVSDDVVVGGDFRVGGEFGIGRALRMEGTFNAPAGVTFDGDAEFTGEVNASEVRVTSVLRASTADIGQNVTARNVTASGNITATGVTAGSTLNADSGYIGRLRVGSCVGC